MQLLGGFADKIGWCFGELQGYDKGAEKNLRKHADAKQWLLGYAEELAGQNLPPTFPADRSAADAAVTLPSQKDGEVPACSFLVPQQIEAGCRAFAERHEVKFGHLVAPVRAALSGTDKGPGLFDIVFLLGKDASVARLRAAAEWLGQ